MTFARYTGQESEEERERILAQPAGHPADQLRHARAGADPPRRAATARSAPRKGLQFLVLDELHTYRGRQGADVAMLVRRRARRVRGDRPAVRRHLGDDGERRHARGPAAGGRRGRHPALRRRGHARPRHRRDAARARPPASPRSTATAARGAAVAPAAAAESLRRLRRRPARSAGSRPRSGWRPRTDRPAACDAAAGTRRRGRRRQLADVTGVPVTDCARGHPARAAARGRGAPTRRRGRPLFAFRLHQFLSKGDTVYVTPRAGGRRATSPRSTRSRCPRASRRRCCSARVLPRVRAGVLRRRRRDPARRDGCSLPRRERDASGGDGGDRLPLRLRRLPVARGSASPRADCPTPG